MDLARGIALLGVAMINVHAIARGWSSHYALDLADHSADVLVEYLVGMLFAHRAIPTLAFLLGAGLALQWQRSVRRELAPSVDPVAALRAKYQALLFLGLAHALVLWPGEIVTAYALIVLILLAYWPKPAPRVRLWLQIASALCVLSTLLFAILLSGGADAIEPIPLSASSFAERSMGAAQLLRIKEFLFYGLSQAVVFEVWCFVLLGLWLTQVGVLQRWLSGTLELKAWFRLGFAAFLLGSGLELLSAQLGGWGFASDVHSAVSLRTFGAPLAMIGSLAGLLALARAWQTTRLPRLRSFFLAAGRTPLTQFFGQSLIFAIVFNDSLIGWHGDMGRAAYSTVALISFVLLAGFARAWLASGHQRGPVEMVWMRMASWIERRGN